jgi:DNA-binding transcriptional MerR regulator
MITTQAIYGTSEAARQLGLPRWKLQYLIDRGDLPKASQVVAGRWLFTEEDVLHLREVLASGSSRKLRPNR